MKKVQRSTINKVVGGSAGTPVPPTRNIDRVAWDMRQTEPSPQLHVIRCKSSRRLPVAPLESLRLAKVKLRPA